MEFQSGEDSRPLQDNAENTILPGAPPVQPAPFVRTPSTSKRRFSSKHLSLFYEQLGTMVQAGVGIQQALTTLQKTAPRVMQSTVVQIRSDVLQGYPFTDAMANHLRSFPELDHQILGIAERSGAIDTSLLSLSKHHMLRAQAKSRILSASVLPALNLVAALFIINLPRLFSSTQNYTGLDYLRDTVGTLVGLVCLIAASAMLFRKLLATHATALGTDFFLRQAPIVGSVRFNYVLSQWVEAVRLMLNAGYGVLDAVRHAGTIIGSPILQHAYSKMEPHLQHQLGVSEAMATTGLFPEMLIQIWATGEQSGRMDDMLQRLSTHYQEVWKKSLDQLATWLPRIIYLMVVIFMSYQILKGAAAYMQGINDALKDTP